MGKSLLTIHKEIERKAYQESPLGKMEKKLRAFYDGVDLKTIPEPSKEFVGQINAVRSQNEEDQMAFNKTISERIRAIEEEAREGVDKMLLDAMTKEWEIIDKYLNSLNK